MPTPGPLASPPDYWCFISYRHADNQEAGRQWASWLQHTLETYEVPADLVGTTNGRGDAIPERIYPVFRDEEELPADARLSTPIEAALQRSRFLLVLCSPNAVRSRFVGDEILRFKQLGKQDRILAAILHGAPTGGKDPAAECFPAALRFAVDEAGQLTGQETEPIAADFRLPDGSQGWTSLKSFRDALRQSGVPERRAAEQAAAYSKHQRLMLLKIVAGVLGVPLNILTKRDQAYQLERQRQRARALRRWLAAVSLLAIAAVASGALALRNWREAAAQRDRVAAKSRELSDTLGISYFREGSARLRDERTALEGLAYLARGVREHGHAASANRLLTLVQQRQIWIAEPAGTWSLPLPARNPPKPAVPRGLEPPPATAEPGRFDLAAKGPHGEIAASWCEDVDSPQGSNHAGAGLHHFRVWDAAGKPLGPWIHADFAADHWVGNIRSMSFSPDGRWIAVVVERWRQPDYFQVWDYRKGAQLGETIEATGESPNYQGATFNLVQFAGVQDVNQMQRLPLLAASSRGDAYWLEIVQARDGTDAFLDQIAIVPHRAALRSAAVLPGASPVLVTASEDGELRITRHRSNPRGMPVPSLHLDKPVDAMAPAPAGAVFLAVNGRRIRAVPVPPLRLDLPVPRLNPLTAEVDEQHTVRCFRKDKPETPLVQLVLPEEIESAQAQDDPAALAVVSADGTVRAYRLEAGKASLAASGRGRELVLDPEGAARKTSLPGEIEDLRPSRAPGQVIATTRDRIYVVAGDSGARWMDEKILFRPGAIPSAGDTTRLSPSGRVLLTRSQHWEPPNSMSSWTMLWDVASGEPLSDRIQFVDDGFTAIAYDRSCFVDDRVANVEGPLLHQASARMLPILADFAELLSGRALDAAGELRNMEQSLERAAGLVQQLRDLAGRTQAAP